MFLLVFGLLGFGIGYWLGMSRVGYIVLALTASAFPAVQIAYVLNNRAAATMLPLVIGLILTICMLVGALVRRYVDSAGFNFRGN
jgi:hypothetical protein